MFVLEMASGVYHEMQWCIGESPVEVHQDDDRVRACDGQGKAERNWFGHTGEMKAQGGFHCYHQLVCWRMDEKA